MPQKKAVNHARRRSQAPGNPVDGQRNVLLALSVYNHEIHRGVARFGRDHRWHIPADLEDAIPKGWHANGVVTLAFREHYVRPPMEELRHVRLTRAKRMLLNADQKIVTIARLTGFQTPHNLCRIFKQKTGITPKQYRMTQGDGQVFVVSKTNPHLKCTLPRTLNADFQITPATSVSTSRTTSS